jgi:hypothetical protein
MVLERMLGYWRHKCKESKLIYRRTGYSTFSTPKKKLKQLQVGDHARMLTVYQFESSHLIGIGSIFPGPYRAFYRTPSADDVKAAYDFIMEVVREDGPFDGVIGFSQGAAIAASVIASETQRNPTEDIFKFAVYVCAPMPFDPLSRPLTFTYDEKNFLSVYQRTPDGRVLGVKAHDWLKDHQTLATIGDLEQVQEMIRGQQKEINAHHERENCLQTPQKAVSADIFRRFHPLTHNKCFRIPTVHVIGLKDADAEQGRALGKLCEPSLTKVVSHSGGHHFPKDRATTIKVAEAIQWAADRAMLQM